MRYAYYPGCSSDTTGKEYEATVRIVCKNLGIELVDIPDWSCCGATAAHGKSHLLNTALPARNLALAEEMGLDVVTPCAACYQQLATANKEMKENQQIAEKVNQATGKNYQGTIKVKSIVEVIGSLEPDIIKAQMVKPLKGLKIAAYYGCLMVRPPSVTGFDDAENPMFLDNLMRLAGAETMDWPHKTECCGGALQVSNEHIVVKLLDKIYKEALKSGANCMVAACPLCHFNLDGCQSTCNRLLGTTYEIPIFYFTQLLGLAMGLNQQELQFNSHFTDTRKVLKLVG
jgi:heterodisulfide reductase subunit B